jgi:hypothetical protein
MKEIVKAFTCPHCGAREESREFHYVYGEIDGLFLDGVIEEIRFECGLILEDGRETKKCGRS